MQNGMDALRTAEAALCDGDGSLRDRLRAAAERYWAAMFFSESWPAPLQHAAARLNERLLANGTIRRTIEVLDEDGVTAVAGQIVDFVELADALLGAAAEQAVSPSAAPC